jgi:ATP-binding cassette subfamily B protein
MIDEYIPDANITKIWYTGGFLLLVLIIRTASGFLRDKFLIILNKNLGKSINTEFMEHLFQLPKKFFDTRKRGDITARIHDIIKIQQAVIRFSGSMIIDLLVIIGSLVFMVFLARYLAQIVLLFIPFYIIIVIVHSKSIKKQQYEVMKGFARVESIYIDSLEGMDDMLSYNAAGSFLNNNKLVFGMFQDKLEQLGFKRTFLNLIAELSGAFLITSILIFGSLEVSRGGLSLGAMVACYSLLSYLLPAINRIVEANISLQGAYVAIQRLMELLLIAKEKDAGNNSFNMKSALDVLNTTFSWSANKPLFYDLQIKIPKCSITAVMGPSGAGKSTLVQLIHRKYQPENGDIVIDGRSINEIKLWEYRKEIGVLPQFVKIFNGTISENIMLGRPSSCFVELNDFISRYGFSKYFERFDKGLDTVVGENGRLLSGGEKQILGFARALYDHPKILMIDEGLNSLDLEIEEFIFSILSKYKKDRAILLNTHNPRVVMKSDYVYILKNGKIVEHGKPFELLNGYGYFACNYYKTII